VSPGRPAVCSYDPLPCSLACAVVTRDNVRPDHDQMVSTPQQVTVQYADQNADISSAPFTRRSSPGRACIDYQPALPQVYLDQAFFSPAAVAFFFGSMSVLEGNGLTGAADRIGHVSLQSFWYAFLLTGCSPSVPFFPCNRRTFRRCCVTGAWRPEGFSQMHPPPLNFLFTRNPRAVYIPTQAINFAIVPSHLRFVFVGVVSLFWSTFHPLVPHLSTEDPDFVSSDTYLSSVNAREQRLYDAEHGAKPTET